MSITVVSSASAATLNNATPTVTIPASPVVLAGDIILAYFVMANDFTVSADPSGYTPVCAELIKSTGTNAMSDVQYKVAVGGEESDAISWTTSEAARWIAGVIVLRGVDTTSPFDVTVDHATHHIYGEDDPSPSCADITTASNGALVIEWTYLSGTTATDAASDNASATEWVNGHNSGAHSLATYYEKETAGAHTGATHTYTDGEATNDWMSFICALKPAAASGSNIVSLILQQH